ncbi:carboxylate/amino acid/amine transporter [Phaeobacter sp. CECT 5382]|uniref:DMT family transporter n=1 Tax=Phaeobacter sp. CECT 5382 TaxID=1712645 RepID=UPI0006DBB573|nr:DMT family transporter [Phaeobacter sp. CECT 5382]CUH89040.1 carboxylate/amino acid/amine transporter [Phaeobacter sp. CECT 5382]
MSDLSKPVLGVVLVAGCTGMTSLADGNTKLLAGGYEAAQLYVISGGVVAILCLVSSAALRLRSVRDNINAGNTAKTVWAKPWHTRCPGAMALRSLATVVAAICFFYAFRLLPFAQVFLFIGVMPLMARVLSGLILKEHICRASWIALLMVFLGIVFLFLTEEGAVGAGHSVGHAIALLGAGAGTISMVIARYISRFDISVLPQVFFPILHFICLCCLLSGGRCRSKRRCGLGVDLCRFTVWCALAGRRVFASVADLCGDAFDEPAICLDSVDWGYCFRRNGQPGHLGWWLVLGCICYASRSDLQ